MKLLLTGLGISHFYAVGDAINCAVGVSAREVIVARAPGVGLEAIVRHPLRDVTAVEIIPGRSASQLHLIVADSVNVILYWPSRANEFGEIADRIRGGMTKRVRSRCSTPASSGGAQRLIVLRAAPTG